MVEWVVAYCKDADCRWVSAKQREDRYSHLDVTEAMIEHTEETEHYCHQRSHYR